MKEFIKEKLVEMYSTCTTDQYGQVAQFNLDIKRLFGDKTEQMLEYIKTDPVISVSTFCNRYFTYMAVRDILDKNIDKACTEALRNNANYLRNINRW